MERTLRPASTRSVAHPWPRVLVVEWELTDDGATSAVLELLHRWRRLGAPARLLVIQGPPPLSTVTEDVGLVVVNPERERLRCGWFAMSRRLLAASRGADVVVAGREVGLGLLMAWGLAHLAHRPLAVLVQAAPEPALREHVPARLRPLTRSVLRSVDAAVCVSPGLVAAVEELGVPATRVHGLLNGVDMDRVRAAAARRPDVLPGTGDGPVVVAVGRLNRQKGFDVLLHAHRRLLDAGIPHRLLLLGEGPDRDALRELADDLGVVNSVHMAGHVADALPLVAAADLFCLPSRWEGNPLALMEAMVLGVPVVATDCVAGPRHLLGGGERGELVPVEDAAALAAALGRHLSALPAARATAERTRTWALAALDVRTTSRQMLVALAAAQRRGGLRRLSRTVQRVVARPRTTALSSQRASR